MYILKYKNKITLQRLCCNINQLPIQQICTLFKLNTFTNNFKFNRNYIVFSNYMNLEPKTLTYMDQCTLGKPFLQTDFP